MNGKERLARAMRHEPVDRVPVMCQLALGHYFLNMQDKYKPHDIWFTSEGFADSLVTLQRRYHFDGILINIPGRDPNWMEQVASIEEVEDGEWITWENGLHSIVPWDDNAQYEPDNLDLEPRPDFMDFDPETDMEALHTLKRYMWGVYHTPYIPQDVSKTVPDFFFRTIDMVKAQVGDEVSIHGEIFSPFTHFMELFGYQDSLIALAMDGEKCKAVLERLCVEVINWGKGQAARGVDAVLISSAFAGGGFISPQMYRDFVVPYERQVTDAIHADYPDMPVYTHTCGKLGDRLELLAESHVNGVDTLDPPPLGNVELSDAKTRIGANMFIKGNMNAVALLYDTEEELVERARNALQVGKVGSGYILSTACSVAPRVEPWKLEKLVDIAETYGK